MHRGLGYARRTWRALFPVIAVFAICLLPSVKAVAAVDYSTYCITEGDCALYDPAACTPSTDVTFGGDNSSDTTDTTPAASGGSTYILGDSISEITEGAYKQAFQGKGPVTVDGSFSRSLNGRGGDGNQLTGMGAIQHDAVDIKKAANVVIELGTNGGTNASSIADALAAIKKIDPESPPAIFWVDVISVDRNDSFNNTITAPANKAIYNNASGNYQVISWFKAVDPAGDPKAPSAQESDPNDYIRSHAEDSLGVHPTEKGQKALAELVAKAVGGASDQATSSSPVQCCSIGVSSPLALTGDTNGVQAYNYFISQGLSPEAASGIVGNMTEESIGVEPERLQGDYTSRHPVETLTPFQIAGGNGGHSIGWGVAQFTPPSSFINAAKKKHASNADMNSLAYQLDYIFTLMKSNPSYYKLNQLKAAKTPEEAAGIFLAGYERGTPSPSRQAYARAYYNLATKGTPLPSNVPVSKSAAGGPDSSGAAAPDTSSATGCPDGSAGGSGTAFTLGDYAWPVDIKKSETNSGYPWPCPGNCHHDGTAAFDLSTDKAVKGNDASVVGRATFAITDGTVENMHIYNGISGCYSMEFKSSKDGYVYWYGHMRRPAVKEGDTVKAGQKVAEVGERKCTGNGSYPHLHIDRGSPKGAPGGYVSHRDAGITDVINKLYAALPDN